MRRCVSQLAGLTLVVWASRASGAVVLQATTATVAETGDVVDVCVVLDSQGEQVAGTQNDLVWDGSCATLPEPTACRIAPGTGKELFLSAAAESDFTFRALVLSFSNTAPIPDGQLYCCAFQVDAAPGTCCPIQVVDAAASDPVGDSLRAIGSANGRVCTASVLDSRLPLPTPMSGAVAQSLQDDGACEVSAPTSRAPVWLLALAALAFAERRRRRSKCPRR
jgi:MYXO-CTERM domain-containing protein